MKETSELEYLGYLQLYQNTMLPHTNHKTFAACGLEEPFFHLCHCVSFFGFGGKQFLVLLTWVPVVPLCQIFGCGGK
jgi:hypothetical protein